jgi:hypothetical protein
MVWVLTRAHPFVGGAVRSIRKRREKKGKEGKEGKKVKKNSFLICL